MRFRAGVAASAALLLFSTTARADGLRCEGLPLTVRAPSLKLVERTCRAAARVLPIMAECEVVLARSLDIEVTDAISGSPDCMGAYHSGEDFIEVLSPWALEDVRRDDSAFHAVPTSSYYESVLAHELAHGAYDIVPCPFRDCLVTSEYVAYSMQVYSMPPAVRDLFEAGVDTEERVSRYDLNSIALQMDPNLFPQNAWRHFSQRQDGCAYVADMMRANFYLDTERPGP